MDVTLTTASGSPIVINLAKQGFSGFSGYSGASGFSGFSGRATSGFSGFSGASSTTSWDASASFTTPYTPIAGRSQYVTMSNNMTINVPSGVLTDGMKWKGRLIVSGGDHVLTLNAAIIIPTLSSFTTPVCTSGKTYLIQFEYNLAKTAWMLESFIGGY